MNRNLYFSVRIINVYQVIPFLHRWAQQNNAVLVSFQEPFTIVNAYICIHVEIGSFDLCWLPVK